MIINNKEKTCILTKEDEKEIDSIDDQIVRPIVTSMINDIVEDIEKGMRQYNIDVDMIDPEGYFEMAYEMFETCYYSYIKECVTNILYDVVIE